MAAQKPYPLIVSLLVVLLLCATLFSGLGALQSLGYQWPDRRLLGVVGLIATHLAVFVLVPIGRLRVWQQMLFLIVQCALIGLVQALVTASLIDYAYLSVVLQAICLFGPRLWIPFSAFVGLAWSGTLFLLSAGILDWLYANVALAFPTTCILAAAIVYARQHRRYEQALSLLAQLQRRHDAAVRLLDEAPQQAALEERQRLAQTFASEMSSALVGAERFLTEALAQAHSNIESNLEWLRQSVAQTRCSAAHAVESLRATVTALRQAAPMPEAPATVVALTSATPAELLSSRAQRALTWALPICFVSLAPLLIVLQHPFTLELLLISLLFCGLLLLVYALTQCLRHPLWLHTGLASQTAAVIALALLTQTSPLLLGLLLVLWQVLTRLPAAQVLALLATLQAPLGLLLIPVNQGSFERARALLLVVVAGAIVAGFMGMARHLLRRRARAELRLQRLRELTAERERQTAELRTLAVAAERTRLAREFHDDIGHRLMLISVQLQLAEELVDDSPDAALAQLAASKEQLHEAWRGVLVATDALDPIDGPTLRAALERLVHSYRLIAGLQVTLHVEGGLAELPRPIAAALYRTVQEGLSNARKHARASQVFVRVGHTSGTAQAQVVDDGSPGTLPGAARRDGYGLVGLRERALQLGGQIAAGPAQPQGFRLALTIPLDRLSETTR
jgi:signal transduction histidine kinase